MEYKCFLYFSPNNVNYKIIIFVNQICETSLKLKSKLYEGKFK